MRRTIDKARHVPLARHVGAVTGALERLSDRHGFGTQVAQVAVHAVVIHHVAHIGLLRVEPVSSGRVKDNSARGIELGESHPIRGKLSRLGV